MESRWKCTIKDGEFGEAKLQSFEVSEANATVANIRGAWILPGSYKRLYVRGQLMMSDTPKERRDHGEFIRNACGDVLINGLGMGCCLNSVIDMEEVSSVTVIENSAAVIALIGPHFTNANIIYADAFTWKPPKGIRYGAVWHDIWASICLDNLEEMHKLHRKYGSKADWQGSWSRRELEYRRRQSNHRLSPFHI